MSARRRAEPDAHRAILAILGSLYNPGVVPLAWCDVNTRAAAAVLALVLSSCGGDDGVSGGGGTLPGAEGVDCGLERIDVDDNDLTVYSGRNEDLVGPLLDEFAAETGVDISILYGADSSTTALQIAEEDAGARSPADVFFSQAPGPVAFLDAKGLLGELPVEVLERVPEQYRADDGNWIGTSGRVRVLVYDPEQTPEASLPASVLDLTDAEYQGRVGIAPENPSFQDFVSYLRLERGDGDARDFLEGLAANDVRTYPNNIAVVEAVDRGEIDLGLANHYYVLELMAQDESLKTRNHYFPADDPGSVTLVAAASVLSTSQHPEVANEFVRFLVSDCAEAYYVNVTKEFALVPGIRPPGDEPPLDEAGGEVADLARLGAEFASTAELIEESGLHG